MPKRKHKISWRRSDYSKLSHTIRKFNEKAFRLEVTRPDLAGHIPEMLDYHEVKATIKTRKELNYFLNAHKRFLKEGMEELKTNRVGDVASKWEIREFNEQQRIENIRRSARLKHLNEKDVTIGGKSTGVKRAEMGKIKENEVKPSKKSFDKFIKQGEWEKAKRMFERRMRSTYDEEKARHMMSNYIRGLIREGYSDKLQRLMNTIPLEDFVDTVDLDEIAQFDFIYDPIELKVREEQLLNLWEKFSVEDHDNKIDIDNIVEEVAHENDE